jgi:hypothetical protein
MLRNVVLLSAGAAAIESGKPGPIKKVVTLIEEMKANVEKEGKEDMKAYDEYKCWCDTGAAEKKEAIEYATDTIADLEAFLEEAAGKEGELKTEIDSLQQDIDEDNTALGTAKSVREKEADEFNAMEADSKESVGLITEALEVLKKAQSLAEVKKSSPQEQQALLQVKSVVERHFPKFQGVMQKDLFDMMSTFQDLTQQSMSRSEVAAGAFLGEVFLPKREAAMIEQSENQKQPSGNAAGAKSYNGRGGQIIGILGEMKDEMVRDLTTAQKAEFKALVDFQNLRAAKMAEVAAAEKQKGLKEDELATLLDRAAKAAADLESMKSAKAADEKFVAELEVNCKTVDDEFAARSKIRGDELVALGDVLSILTSDEARDLFAKSVGGAASFFQVSASTQERRTERAFQHIAKVAKSHKNWMLMSLAVRVRLDAFTKVKEQMDKMLAELKTQQQEEYDKNEQCKKDIDQTEDDIWTAKREKKDLEEKNLDLSNTLETLAEEIKTLKEEVSEMEVSLKKAGIDRKAENEMFQQQIFDQRATVKVLNMALDRMKDFYEPSLMQVRAHGKQPTPGAAVAAPPPKPKAYEKSGGAGGVMELIKMIIEDSKREEQELQTDENAAQKRYGEYVESTAASIEASRGSIAEKEKQVAETESALSETKEGQLANKAALENLNTLLTAHHSDCDFVMKYFKLRQEARQQEMDSIEEAKAILSGADFGK